MALLMKMALPRQKVIGGKSAQNMFLHATPAPNFNIVTTFLDIAQLGVVLLHFVKVTHPRKTCFDKKSPTCIGQ